MSVSENNIELRKYEARLSVWKTGIIGGAVAIVTTAISVFGSTYVSYIEEKTKIRVQQMADDNEFIGRFLDKAISENPLVMSRWAEYMSIVSASEEQRSRWTQYREVLDARSSREESKVLVSAISSEEVKYSDNHHSTIESIDFEEEFRIIKGDELALARLGERAFELGEYEWTVRLLRQADAVKASGVWQSRYPYLIGALLALDRNTEAEATKDELLNRIRFAVSPDGYGYLGHSTTLGFLLNSFSAVLRALPENTRLKIDDIMDSIVELKKRAD